VICFPEYCLTTPFLTIFFNAFLDAPGIFNLNNSALNLLCSGRDSPFNKSYVVFPVYACINLILFSVTAADAPAPARETKSNAEQVF